MFLEVFPTGLIQANCTLIGDLQAGCLAVIDPGAEGSRIASRIADSGLELTMILHTHAHVDHAGGTADLVSCLDHVIPVALHREELPLYQNVPQQGKMFGINAEAGPEPSLWLTHGQRLELGSLSLEARHTPGHSPGSVSFVVHGGPEKLVIVGDVLFAGSIGRTDLWGGDFPTLERSIREQLYTLPDDTRVITGHGPDTTIGREKASNPFVRV